jgi:hypothetical protein
MIEEYFSSVSGEDDWNPRYNIAPTHGLYSFVGKRILSPLLANISSLDRSQNHASESF